jgi:hypothetical protein
MSAVVNLRETPDDYFGGCPTCGRCDGYLYMNTKEEWLVCNRHRVRWAWGVNLTSRWRDLLVEDPSELARQHAKASTYTIVKAVYS